MPRPDGLPRWPGGWRLLDWTRWQPHPDCLLSGQRHLTFVGVLLYASRQHRVRDHNPRRSSPDEASFRGLRQRTSRWWGERRGRSRESPPWRVTWGCAADDGWCRAMRYLHCPRCRLAIRCRADYLTMRHCPRCLAHAGIATKLFTSPLNAYELRGGRPGGPDRPDRPPPQDALLLATDRPAQSRGSR